MDNMFGRVERTELNELTNNMIGYAQDIKRTYPENRDDYELENGKVSHNGNVLFTIKDEGNSFIVEDGNNIYKSESLSAIRDFYKQEGMFNINSAIEDFIDYKNAVANEIFERENEFEEISNKADDFAGKMNFLCDNISVRKEQGGDYPFSIEVFYKGNEIGTYQYDDLNEEETMEDIKFISKSLKAYEELKTHVEEGNLKNIDISVKPGESSKITIEDNDGKKIRREASDINELNSVVSEFKSDFLGDNISSGMKM
ncbi:hypothetical protein [Gluconobacter cerinus]|uniref:hypothetical protein n=1 Tax=Gluconobacter cerinus TaxID=38307 RepID=UPI001B8B00CA|nr:hypothetical protein [Gluconobacter cerinus]MBS1038080.1 hypothetical protein [Gluconobacter cerinus]